jgi:hypothetical protein
MPRRSAAVGALLLFAALPCAVAEHPRRGARHPFMLLVTSLRPPQGDRLAEPFSKAVSDALERDFDTTTYQTVFVATMERAESMSNHKKDLIVYTDTTDWHSRGPTHNTLVLWVKYRTGFLLGRTEIAYTKERLKRLPAVAAATISTKIREEFLGEAALRGGPPGMTITLVDRLHLSPPCRVHLPAGQHALVSRYEGFATRVDTIDILPGKTTHKRVLLLPDN